MKRKQKRLSPNAVQEFLAEMQKLARSWSSDDVTVTVKNAVYFWAADEMLEYLEKCDRTLPGDKACRAFLKWLRTEPPRIERLITAANRHLRRSAPTSTDAE